MRYRWCTHRSIKKRKQDARCYYTTHQKNDNKGYYDAMLAVDRKKDPNAKWRGTYYQGYGTEQSNPYFKAFINQMQNLS